ncbi:MAG: hypothetical protein ACK5P7_01885 [Bdellovibrio sp.]
MEYMMSKLFLFSCLFFSFASNAQNLADCSNPFMLNFQNNQLVIDSQVAHKIEQLPQVGVVMIFAQAPGQYQVDSRQYAPTNHVVELARALGVSVQKTDIKHVNDWSPDRAQCSDGTCFQHIQLVGIRGNPLASIYTMGHRIGICR